MILAWTLSDVRFICFWNEIAFAFDFASCEHTISFRKPSDVINKNKHDLDMVTSIYFSKTNPEPSQKDC